MGYVVVLILCYCPVLMAGERDEGNSKTMPAHFIGVWVERGENGKELGRITASDKSIIWERYGADTETIKTQDANYSEDTKKLTFSSGVVVAQGAPMPSEKLGGNALYGITLRLFRIRTSV